MNKAFLWAVIIFSITSSALRAQAMTVAVTPNQNFANEVAELVNEYRISQGLPPMTRVSLLDKAAFAKARNLVSSGVFTHRGGAVYGIEYFANGLGYRLNDYRLLGENLICGAIEPQHALDAWLQSALHRKNILEPNFSEYGMGFAQGNVNYNRCHNPNDLIVVMAFGGAL